MAWASKELASTDLGDARLDERLIAMVEDLSEHPESSCPEALGQAGSKAAYRFWSNPRVVPEEILLPHAAKTAVRAAEYPVVLVPQDTTEIDLTGHRHTQGTGYLGSRHRRGLWLHSLLVFSPEGLPLGLLRQFTWARAPEQYGKRHRRRQRPLEEKESRRWLDGLEAVQQGLPGHPRVVLMGDRESDLFDLFARSRLPQVELLVRACRETRRVEHPQRYLKPALQASPIRGYAQVTLPRTGRRPERTANLALRWESLEVRAPRHGAKRPSQRLNFILVEEVAAPAGETPLRWVLATTLPIESIDDALRYVQWYAYRWRIEHFHFVLKSGCQIEQLQLEAAERMERAIATFSLVAWRLMWLTCQARTTPDAPCTKVLETHEWQSLYATIHPKQPLPAAPPSLREAVRMIAQLGGFLGRKGDGEPGYKTLWRGWRRLHDISQTWLLLRPNTPPSPGSIAAYG